MDREKQLLNGARRFDEEALGEIYDLVSPEIYRYAWRLLGDTDLAQECVAETFSRFLSALKSDGGPRDYLKAYLFRIAHNWMVDHFARKPDDVNLEQVEHLSQADHHVEASAELALEIDSVRQALRQLTPEQRTVIILKYLESWDHAMIAKALNKPVGAVKALQHRGLESLRRIFARQENNAGKHNSLFREQSSVIERVL